MVHQMPFVSPSLRDTSSQRHCCSRPWGNFSALLEPATLPDILFSSNAFKPSKRRSKKLLTPPMCFPTASYPQEFPSLQTRCPKSPWASTELKSEAAQHKCYCCSRCEVFCKWEQFFVKSQGKVFLLHRYFGYCNMEVKMRRGFV